jgi:hypothetical protein
VIIKDRLIEVDIAEALAIAGKGEKVRCVGDGTGLMTIMDALEGLTFFAPESALAEPDALKAELDPVEVEKFEKEIAKLGSATLSPGPAHFDTPEDRTRAIIGSVERYDEKHGDPPVTKQDAAEDAPKQEASEFIPFAGALSGGALKK